MRKVLLVGTAAIALSACSFARVPDGAVSCVEPSGRALQDGRCADNSGDRLFVATRTAPPQGNPGGGIDAPQPTQPIGGGIPTQPTEGGSAPTANSDVNPESSIDTQEDDVTISEVPDETPGEGDAPTTEAGGTKDNRSGLGDGTNPGQGHGRDNSPNTGTDNPGQGNN